MCCKNHGRTHRLELRTDEREEKSGRLKKRNEKKKKSDWGNKENSRGMWKGKRSKMKSRRDGGEIYKRWKGSER